MNFRKTKIATTLILLSSSISSVQAATVEANPYLSVFDKELIVKWDIEDAKRTVAMQEVASKVSDKIENVGLGQIQANTARSAKTVETAIQQRINKLNDELEQPSTMCAMLSNNNAVGALNTVAKNNAGFSSQSSVMSALDDRQTEDRLKANYHNNRKLFCSTSDQINGVCDVRAEPELQDGDINAALLFGSTETTTRDESQVIALDALVQYISGVQYAPEAIDKTKVERSGTARAAYDNERRRYASILSLATEGLYDTAEAHSYNPMEVIEFENTERTTELAGSNEIGDSFYSVDAVSNGQDDTGDQTNVPPTYFNPTSKQPLLSPAAVTSTISTARKLPNSNIIRAHRGTDIRVPIGTPVITLADGKVIASAYQANGAGNFLVLYHPTEGYITRYFHLSKKLVKVGSDVKAGQLIAKSGNTGIGTGPHLHYELYKAGGGGIFDKSKFLDYRTSDFPKASK